MNLANIILQFYLVQASSKMSNRSRGNISKRSRDEFSNRDKLRSNMTDYPKLEKPDLQQVNSKQR